VLLNEIVIHGQCDLQQRSSSVEIINPLEKLPSSPRMVFHSKPSTKLRKAAQQINQIQKIQNFLLIRWSRIRDQELPALMYPRQELFQLVIQQWKSSMQALQVYRFIECVNHGMFSSRKSRHGTELQMPMIYTGIMEMGNLRKHGKTEWKRSQKIAKDRGKWIDTRRSGHYT